jgi:hypothetical protein
LKRCDVIWTTVRVENEGMSRHVLAPQVKRPPAVQWFVHSSGRFDRPLSAWRGSTAALRGFGTLITGTESASTRTRAEVDSVLGGVQDWAYAHLTGHDGEGECYATWDTRARVTTAEPYTLQLSTETWTRSPEYGGKPAAHPHALVVPLAIPNRPHRRNLYVIVVHMPLRNTPQREHVWLLCADTLRQHVHHLRHVDPGCQVDVVGDWNRDYRAPVERALLDKEIARPLRLTPSWFNHLPAVGGTHNNGLIDGAYTDMPVLDAELLTDDRSSDHRPWRYQTHATLL